VISNFISKTVRGHFRARYARFHQPHTEANFKKSGCTLCGGAVSARSDARTVVKCTPMESLMKTKTGSD